MEALVVDDQRPSSPRPTAYRYSRPASATRSAAPGARPRPLGRF